MHQRLAARLAAFGLASIGIAVAAQSKADQVAAHVAAAEKASAGYYSYVMGIVCPQPPNAPSPEAAPVTPGPPARGTWYFEPTKVFDNFYYIGTKTHGSWALTTSAGIIVFDALYDYAVIDEVEAGLKKLGLDPAQITYLIITHGHGDHHGGTRYLQDKYRPRVVMGSKDWDLVLRDTRNPRPTRDMNATDGQQITLGDTTVTLHLTPGHTGSTISSVIPLKEGGTTHVGVEWGGTAVRASATAQAIDDYVNSAARFRKIAAAAKADVLFTNHSAHDHTMEKLAALKTRAAGAPHPFVLGPQGVDRYLTVAEECARALAAGK